MYDREIYFDAVRDSLFGGSMTQQQVDGQTVILAVGEYHLHSGAMPDQRHLAYMLATTFHETAATMWAIAEYGKGEGRDYGETDPETGQAYYGRGLVQLTWRDNYARATQELGLTGERDIEWHADRALDILIATRVMFQGMKAGWFTGKKLDDYFNVTENDPVNARQIINGNDKDELIADYHYAFLDALIDAAPVPGEPAAVMLEVSADIPIRLMLKRGPGVT